MDNQSEPKFDISSVVKCPTVVADSGQLKIMGYEYGPGNARTLTSVDRRGWVYYVREFPDGKHDFFVSEKELIQWNSSSKPSET
jgi:hypothetical protein